MHKKYVASFFQQILESRVKQGCQGMMTHENHLVAHLRKALTFFRPPWKKYQFLKSVKAHHWRNDNPIYNRL